MKRKSRHTQQKVHRTSLPMSAVALMMICIFIYLTNSYKPKWVYNWSRIRSQIKDTIQLIEDYGSVTSGIVGVGGTTPLQWYRRRWLMKNATEMELLRLTGYPDGVIKATAYEALIRRGSGNRLDLLFMAITDTTTFFNFQSGCISETVMIGEYLIEYALHLHHGQPPSVAESRKSGLAKAELKQIDELYKEIKSEKWTYYEKYSDHR